MSMPKYPEVDPELDRERAIDMILASIAMEELGLSHIINAEGEKLQFVLSVLEKKDGKEIDIDKLLCVNQSISNLLEVVSQNQMLLKNKMDKALGALPNKCFCSRGPTGPTGPTGPQGKPGPICPCPPKCNAFFKGENKCETWYAGCALPWNKGKSHGKCIYRDPCDKTRIMLSTRGQYMISFAMNINNKSKDHCDIEIELQMLCGKHNSSIFTFNNHIPCPDTTSTIAISGILVDNFDDCNCCLLLKLLSPNSLLVRDCIFSIIEI